MAVTERASGANTGPRSGSSWGSPLSADVNLTTYTINASQSVSVNGTSEQSVYIVPAVSVWMGSGRNQDALTSDNVIANLNTVYLGTTGVALAATQASVTYSFFLRRAGLVIGGGAFAGWTIAGNTAIAAFSAISVPFLITNTALVAPPGAAAVTAANALLPLQPLDVITFSVITAGAQTIPFLYVSLDIA
jgi:hypothetical protein